MVGEPGHSFQCWMDSEVRQPGFGGQTAGVLERSAISVRRSAVVVRENPRARVKPLSVVRDTHQPGSPRTIPVHLRNELVAVGFYIRRSAVADLDCRARHL